MANDLLQLDFVVKQYGLDEALTLTAKFEREIMKTVNAYQKGQITQDRYQKSLLNTKRQMSALTDENGRQIMSIHKANALVQRFIATQGNLNKSLNANSAAMQQTKRNTNQLGVLFQQSGYQIGDFAVQVQSGTNVMVAFGQQATQLIGTFAMLAKSTAAIAAFSTLGIIVPIATAIAGAFMRTAKSAEEAKDKVTGLTKTLRDFRQEQRALEQGITTDQLALVDRVNAIKELRQEQLQLIKDLQSNSNASNIMNVDLSVAERLSALIGSAFDPSKQADAESVINTLNDLMDKALDQQRELQVKINAEYVKRTRSMEDANKLASIENKFGQDHVKYRNEVRRQAENALELEIKQSGVSSFVAERLRDRLKSEYDIIDAKADQDDLDRLALARQEAIQNSYKSGLAVLQQMTSEVEKREAAVKRIKDSHEDQMGTLLDQIKLLEIESRFGKNNSRYRQESAKQARDAYKESREALGVKGNLLKKEMELYDQLQVSRKEAELNLNILKAQARTPIYEPLTQAQIEANKLNQELIDGFNTANDLKKELGEGAYEALRLAGVDMASPISDAKKEAAKLADEMGIALEAAIALKKAQSDEELVMSQPVVTGKVTDRYDIETLMRMGYTKDYLIAIGKIKEETKKAGDATEELADKIRDLEDAADPFRAYNRELKELDKMLDKNQISQKAYNKAVDDLNEGLGQTIPIIGDVEQAFSDWLANGMRDFKGFVSSIKDMFVKLLADLAAQAVRNRILIPIVAGVGGGLGNAAAAGTAGGAVAGGGIGATLAAGAYGVGQGLSAALGIGGFTSAGIFNVGANAAVATAAGASPLAASIGAALPVLAAVVFLVGLFTKKTKLLDSGLRTTIEGFDVAIETFKLTQTSRLFGLLKGPKVTTYEDAPAELADPLIEAIGDMQQSILDAAGTLGIGAGLFENFSYQFKVSLKGLTEEEQLQKINEEITKMGDSFASLSGHFETMNELLQVAQQRYDLETRLLSLLNDQSALLTRQRQIERAAVHELNQGTLTQIYALEDAYGAVNSAFATVQRSIEARKTKITEDFSDIMDALQARIKTAQDDVGVSRGILGSLEGASGDSGMTRGAGMAYLRSLRGASRITDQKKLDDALQAIADPSQDLYTNFVDYQRDFQDQTNLVRELEEKAKLQLSTDEQTLLQLQDEAQAAQDRYDGQIDKLDEQLEAAQAQLNALFGIDTSVKSVAEAISALGSAVNAAQAAQETAKASSAAATGGGSKAIAQYGGDVGLLEKYDVGTDYSKSGKTYDHIKLQGASQLMDAAKSLGVQTSGKTGAEIQQAISNAGYLAVSLDKATRGQQFAMGGMFGGGIRMVGERGPEIEATGPSRIFSTKQTAELFRNPELVAEVRSLREEVAGLRSESRQLQASNSKYVKRNYDINRKWDTEGLPATRT
jgi:hypothetical protein